MLNKKAFSLIELSVSLIIVSIIIAGVITSSRMLNEAKIANAKTLTQGSPVASISGLSLWLDATNDNAFDVVDPDEDRQISTWKDTNPQSSIKRDFTQTTSNAKPIFKATGINGLPALYFDGSNDYMKISSTNIFDFTNGTGITIFMVPKILRNLSTAQVMLFETNSERFSLQFTTTYLRFDFVSGTVGSGSIVGVSSSAIHSAATVLTFTKTTSSQSIYINGALNHSQNGSASFSLPLNAEMALGCYSSSGTRSLFTQFNLGELIIFNRYLKTEERKAVEQYLGKKWGIDVS